MDFVIAHNPRALRGDGDESGGFAGERNHQGSHVTRAGKWTVPFENRLAGLTIFVCKGNGNGFRQDRCLERAIYLIGKQVNPIHFANVVQ